jgi:hypothetical protein
MLGPAGCRSPMTLASSKAAAVREQNCEALERAITSLADAAQQIPS